MPKLTPSQIYAREEAKQRKRVIKEQKAAERARRRITEADARQQNKEINAMRREMVRRQKAEARQSQLLVKRKQRARAVSARKSKRIAKRVWRRLI